MALKALLLRKKIDDAEKALAALREKDAGFDTREAELETAISEAASDEERSAVEEMINAFEAERGAHGAETSALEARLTQLRADLEAEEKQQREAAQAAAAPATTPAEGRKDGGTATMEIRDKFFGLTMQERDALFAREEVRSWLGQMRSIISRRDAGGVSNAQILIPQVMLPFLREIVEENSKMLKHTNLSRISGEGRQIIDGGFPEAIWTDCCGTLNELNIGFYDVEIGCWKVGGFIQICNALLEDSDIALAALVLEKLGQSIGYAVDKAILYGTGTKMPLGILPRLAQESAPADYPATGRPWTDLHTSNIVTLSQANSTGIALFRGLVTAYGKTQNRFAREGKWWALNEDTLSALIVEGMEINASGVIVSAMGDTMPIVGGKVETLDFIPDNVIIAGHDALYLMAERAGLKYGQSEHYKFVEDRTVFKATARYDGKPVIPEGFVAIGLNGVTPTANAVSFQPDAANDASLLALTVGALSLSPSFAAGTYDYTASATNATGTAAVLATPTRASCQVEITVKSGSTETNVVNGGIAALAVGKNTITVKTVNGGDRKTYTVVVTRAGS
ncbi:MAG: phage major capsid protein [Oscillospiraceae bacterium]|nr:phage major capsid protein [Oscillospiraceae bacterium]